MILLDTSVLSELARTSPSEAVIDWLERHALADYRTTVVSEAEMRYGVARLPDGRRKERLAGTVSALFEIEFAGRVLAFEPAAAPHYAEIVSARDRTGRPIATEDAIIAAITRHHSATLATRNVRDFEGCGIEIVNPWEG
ncbi:MAG: type II toxin-antitoxin system VapC family toxin [Proteobacteria bacterium]|nr:type II toxin-antitoxin system VapC family toxin [Pseudomonadota bacterium]